MSMRSFIFAFAFILTSCNWETHEIKDGDVQIYVPEDRFVALKRNMTEDDVTKAIGAPRRKDVGVSQTWHYGVWRGEAPSLIRWLLSSEVKPATLLDGRVYFFSGRVTRVEVVESSAVTFPPRQSRHPNKR